MATHEIRRETPKYILVSGYFRIKSDKIDLIPLVIIDLCYEYYREIVDIPLKLGKHRGSLGSVELNGPKWLIVPDDVKPNYNYYCYEYLKENEEDWIMFSIDIKKSLNKYKQKLFWLKQIKKELAINPIYIGHFAFSSFCDLI